MAYKDPARGLPVGAGPPTQMSSWARATLPFRQARCSAVRPSASRRSRSPRPGACASSRMTVRRSSSAVARSRCWPRDSSMQGSGARRRASAHTWPGSTVPSLPCKSQQMGVVTVLEETPLPHHSLRGVGRERGRGGDRCAHWNQEAPRKACPTAYKVGPHLEHLGPVRDADSQAPSQPRPPPEPPEGAFSPALQRDSATLWCESQGLALISFALGIQKKHSLPGARTMPGQMPQARGPSHRS